MSTTMQASVVISAKDETAAAFAAIKRHMDDLTRASRAASAFPSNIASQVDQTARAIRHQKDLTREIERTSAAQRRAMSDHAAALKVIHEREHARANSGFFSRHGGGGVVLGAAAGYVGAHSVMHLAKGTVEAGAERQHVRVGAQNAGIDPEELKRMEGAAVDARRGAPNLSVTEIMELHKEARSAVQHAEEAFHLIPDLSRAASILKGMGATNANIADLVKGGESLGLMNDPHRFHDFLSGQIKAMAVMGKTIDTTQIYEAAKYSKSAGATLSDRFLNTVMPSLIQEMHGSSAGDALAMLTKTFRGGLQHKHLPVERLNELGLLEDPSKIRRAKRTGQIMGYAGNLKGDALLASDPDRWTQEYFKPAAAKKGITDIAGLVKLASETLPSTAANLVRIFLQQEETLKNHAKLYGAAPDMPTMTENQRGDPIANLKALSAAFNDLGAAVSGPAMGTIASGLNTVSESVRALSRLAGEYPKTAMTAGGAAGAAALGGAGLLAYQVGTGFGLPAAAAELTIAAKALEAAAAKQAIPGGAPGKLATTATGAAAGAATTGGATLGGALAGAAAPVGLGLLAGAGAGGAILFTMEALKAFGAVEDTKDNALAGNMRGREAAERAAQARRNAGRPSKWTRGGRFAPPSTPLGEPYGPPMPPEMFGPPMPPATFPGNVSLPPIRPPGLSGGPDLRGSATAAPPQQVNVAGEAKVGFTVQVQESPNFSARIQGLESAVVKLSGAINSGGVGSTGRGNPDSMPGISTGGH